jgi:major vault protein
MPETRESDLVLAPNEYAYVLDQNSGAILPAVGPTKRTLENTERTVLFEPRIGKFNETPPSSAKQIFTKANDRSYVILENPAKGDRIHPTKGRDNPMPELHWGKKQNMPGSVCEFYNRFPKIFFCELP